MKTNHPPITTIILSVSCAALSLLFTGCASTGESSSTPGKFARQYQATDGRTIDIGRNAPADGGWTFKNPHMEKCWLADGFNFQGYDTLYIAPTLSTAKFQEDERGPHDAAKQNLVTELERFLTPKGIFKRIVTRESDLKPEERTLKLENTITEYSKGGGAARYFVGLYGGGQPALRVEGKLTDGGRAVLTFQARRSGVSANARMGGAFMADEAIQVEDIRSLVLDLSDFVSAMAGQYPPKN